MNRNVETRFAELPSVDIERSIFDRSCTHKTSFNVGDLIPFYCDEVLPGDTFQITTSKVVRLQTLLTPVMDNLYLDTYFFFVPNRLVWNHWKEFNGENTESAWIPQTQYQIPSISAPSGGFQSGTLADYFGLPVGVEWSNTATRRPMALPFRAYALICNEFFRDENLTDPLNIPLGDANQTGSNGDNYINDVANGGKPFKVAKYHDYFTSCLPSPQKGPSVTFPLLSGDRAPVFAASDQVSRPAHLEGLAWTSVDNSENPVGNRNIVINRDSVGGRLWTYGAGAVSDASGRFAITPSNLIADLSQTVGSVTINQLRLAFQLQKYYEKLARYGSRYTESIRANFGVVSPDSRLQRPEYLGGNRIPVTVHEVLNNAQSEKDFLGDLGAMSVTADVHEDFVQSFTEHGFVIGVCCMRYDHSYPQGLERFWCRKSVSDYYLPVFANIGEQPVYTSEIYASADSLNSDDVFGYQECWADYRYKPNRVSGLLRPGVTNSLASWHFADHYSSAPTLSDSWIREDKSNVDRALSVTSSVSDQAWMDIYVKNICTRCMPMYSIPGLIDHH